MPRLPALARPFAALALAFAILSSPAVTTGEPLDVELGAGVDPFSAAISPDGARVVFELLPQMPPFVSTGLVSVPIESSSGVRLDPPGTSTPELVGIALDRAVFSARTDQSDSELFSAPLAGGPATKLNHPLAAGARALPGPITPDGTQVVYVTDPPDRNQADGLFLVPVEGGAALPLDMPLPADDPRGLASSFRISPDGGFGVGVWFVTSDEDFGPEPAGLFSVPLAGAPAVVLDGGLFFDHSHEISPDSSRVIYRRSGVVHRVPGSGIFVRDTDLHSVPLSGGQPTKLNLTFPSGGHVFFRFRITPDSSRVAYLADMNGDDLELYSVPSAGGTATKLSRPEGVRSAFPFEMSPDGERIVFAEQIGSVQTLFSVPVSGGALTRLSHDSLRRISYIRVSSDARRVVYAGRDQLLGDVWDLYSVPLEGGEVTRLGGPMECGTCFFESAPYTLTPDGSRVIFRADPDADGVFELFSIPIKGGATTRLNAPLAPDAEVSVFAPILSSPDSRHAMFSVRRIVNGFGTSALHSARLPPLVRVDVKPGQDPNRIQLRSRGLVAVALLGSDEVDVADVDLASLAFGPAGAEPATHPQLVDFDSDGFVDLVTRYRVQETGIARGDTEACLAGVHDGFAFESCDGVVTVGGEGGPRRAVSRHAGGG